MVKFFAGMALSVAIDLSIAFAFPNFTFRQSLTIGALSAMLALAIIRPGEDES